MWDFHSWVKWTIQPNMYSSKWSKFSNIQSTWNNDEVWRTHMAHTNFASLFASGEVRRNVLAARIKLGTMRRFSHAFTTNHLGVRTKRSELIIFLLNSERATLWMYRGRRRSYILCIGLYCWFSCHVGRGRCEMGLRVRWGLTCEKSSVSGRKKTLLSFHFIWRYQGNLFFPRRTRSSTSYHGL